MNDYEMNQSEIETIVNGFGTTKNCPSCRQPMSSTKTDITKFYKKKNIILKNFPVKCCERCEEVSYGTNELNKYLAVARHQFDKTGKTMLDCDTVK